MKRKDPPLDLGGSSSKTSKPNVDRPLPPAPPVAPPAPAVPPAAPPVTSRWFMYDPRTFVAKLEDEDQRFHVLLNMKRWMVDPDWKTSALESNDSAVWPPMDDSFPRAVRAQTADDKLAIRYARDMFQIKANTEEGEKFIWDTMLCLRSNLKGKGYLRRKHGYFFPYKVRFDRFQASDYDWLDYESSDDEGVFVGKDEEADEDLYQFGDGSLGYFDYKGDQVIISSPENRKKMVLELLLIARCNW